MNHHNVIMDQLTREFIEVVDKSKPNLNNRVHYLPHHGVEKKDSITTPLRIVFNCSSGKPSLNDCLHSGPSLVVDLIKVLLRFRLHSYAVTSDIEKAFLMISLHEEDQDCTRFLWPENPWDAKSKILTYRFKVVLFGATCSQFLLNASIIYHLKKYSEKTSESIMRNLYVDNLFFTSNSKEEVLHFYERSREIMSSAHLTVREWISNVEKLNDLASQNNDISKRTSSAKILGILWYMDSDQITFVSPNFGNCASFSKRIVLSQASKLYDPLGYLCPVSVRSKIFLQKMWKNKIGWDEPLADKEACEWSKILEDLKQVVDVHLPRKSVTDSVIQLHAFSDASLLAYGITIYLVDSFSSNLIMAKARVAPLKEQTVPQLELTAALLMARLVKYVLNAYEKELKFESINL